MFYNDVLMPVLFDDSVKIVMKKVKQSNPSNPL